MVSLPLIFIIFFQTDFREVCEFILDTQFLHEEDLACLMVNLHLALVFLKLIKFNWDGFLKCILWTLFLSRYACLHSSVNQGTREVFPSTIRRDGFPGSRSNFFCEELHRAVRL